MDLEEAVIENITRISPDVRQYTLSLKNEKFDGIPGGHTIISQPDGFKKPYSVLCVEGSRALFMIRDVKNGGVSTYMAEQEQGDTVLVDPDISGNLYLKNPDRPAALISTGTGITPMMGILQQYLREGESDLYFMFGDKSTDQLLYRETLKQYELLYDATSRYVLSREQWDGLNGYVQEHLYDVIPDTHSETERDFYICGVPPMVVATKEKLRELGVPSERIHSEGWEGGAAE